MKFLRVFVYASLVLFIFLNVLSASGHAYAADTYESITTEVLGDIDATQAKLDAKKASVEKMKVSGSITPKDYTQYQYNYNKYSEVITNVKDVYTSSVSTYQNQNLTVYDGQAKATADANNTLSSELTRINPVLNNEHRAIFNQLSKEINAKNLRYNQILRGNNVDPDGLTTGGSADRINNSSRDSVTTPIKTGKVATGSCTFFSWTISGCINEGVIWFIKHTLLEIAGFLVWASANMFNYAVQMGILQFSSWAPDSLFPIWTVVRQIVSLIIVFIGLYLGFLYILGKDEKFGKYMAWIIVFAVFVNFSYPLTRIIIDLSNIISLNIYASIVGDGALQAKITDPNTAGALIMTKLGLQGLVAAATSEDVGGLVNSINSIPSALLTVVYVLYAGYIFLMMTAIISMRTIALVALTIVSPLLLVDGILPMLGEKAKELRRVFFEQIVVAPIFMITLALTMKFLDVFSTISTGGTTLNTVANTNGEITIKVFFNILMMLLMLHIMLTVVKKMSGEFGKFATEFAGKVGGFAAGTSYGVALRGAASGSGFLGRQTIGAYAEKLSQNKWVNSGSFLANRVSNLSNSLADSTFDFRNSKYVAGKANALGLSGGMGTGARNGYRGVMESKTKDALSKADRIKTRYERDQYDANGNLIAKKGDIDQEAVKARDALLKNAGGSIFQTKEQNEKITQALVDKQIKEDTEAYKAMKDKFNDDGTKVSAEEQKGALYSDLTKQLEEIKKTDPDLQSPEGQALRDRVNALAEVRLDEKQGKTLETFNKISGDIKGPNGVVTAKQQRVQAISDVQKEIDAIKEKDKTLAGKEAQTLLKTLDDMKKRTDEQDQIFIRSAQNAQSKIEEMRKNGREKEINKYVDNLSTEIQNYLRSQGSLPNTNGQDDSLPSLTDIDGTPLKDQGVGSTGNTQTPSWRGDSGSSVDTRVPAVTRKNNVENTQKQPATQTSVGSSSTTSFDPSAIHTQSFAQRMEQNRIKRQQENLRKFNLSPEPTQGGNNDAQPDADEGEVSQNQPRTPQPGGGRPEVVV